MKIDYPVIEWTDVQAGDTILTEWVDSNSNITTYREFTVADPANYNPNLGNTYYLIDRPKPVFPEDYGTVIIAKKVRGDYFPGGVVLARQRGSRSAYGGPMWKSLTQKIGGADQHGERQIEDWVLAKVVPA